MIASGVLRTTKLCRLRRSMPVGVVMLIEAAWIRGTWGAGPRQASPLRGLWEFYRGRIARDEGGPASVHRPGRNAGSPLALAALGRLGRGDRAIERQPQGAPDA